MANPPVDKDHAERFFTAIEEALTAGWAPPGKTRNKKGAIYVACESLDINTNSGRSHLAACKAVLGRDPDWSRWTEPAPRQSAIPPVEDGYYVKGTSTLYDPKTGEAKLEWVKTGIDQERQKAIFAAMVDGLSAKLPRAKPVKLSRGTSDHLMAVYPVGDQHMGMLAWGEEAGEDFDLEISETVLTGAVDHLVGAVPKCDTALFAFLGDFMHYDGFMPVTPTHKNLLDADSRFPKMVRAAIRCIRYMILRALEHHGRVHVIIEIGNHDLASSVFLMEALSNIYESEPRVTVDTSPRHFHYFHFGKCLIGTHHGHGPKIDQLPVIMATDQPELWGETLYRYWYTGHLHHDHIRDFTGCRWEQFRVLGPSDAHHANKGYRPQRDMKAIVMHKDYGEVARQIVNPRMLA